MTSRAVPLPGSWRAHFNDIIRSFAGAFLFGIPFIYTMEMWWISTYLEAWKLLTFFAIALGINIVLGHLVYLDEDTPWHVAAGEAIFNLAIGIVGSAIILALLGRFSAGDPIVESIAKVILEAIPTSIGAGVTHRIERRRAGAGPEERQEPKRQRVSRWAEREPRSWEMVRTQLLVTAAGGLFLSLPLASTAEIQFVAAGTTSWHILALIFFSLLVTYMIIYRNSLMPERPSEREATPLDPLTDTMMNYSVALLIAALTLYLFDRIEFGNPLLHVVTQIVVLGLPATVGGAVGRRLL
ncbi:MAG: DUF2391 family protein [Candidatus Promineifilaceae bacterium]|nr:DUF2391 family protein [Candidatus Promineifilaceae bacterium]